VVGLIIGVVLVVVGLPFEGIAALVIVTVGLTWWAWRGAAASVIRAVGARPSRELDRARLHNLVDGLCATMGLPTPTVLVVDHDRPNAMTVGRHPQTAVLIVTSGLDASLSLVELEGVLAHELVHIKRHDSLLSGVAVRVVAPLSAVLGTDRGAAMVHRLVGPGREFSADQRAAAVVRYPVGLGSALHAMVTGPDNGTGWPPGGRRSAALTRWLWIDPSIGGGPAPADGELDDPSVRAAALSLL
jgi:heat shock protein HtpX